MPNTRKKRHWQRVEQRRCNEAEQLQRDMDLDPDTVAGQSRELPPSHPYHYELVTPPPAPPSSTCTIQ